MKRPIISASIVIAASLLLGISSGVAVHAAGIKDYSAIMYDSSNGLPTSEANSIVQTRDGFLWIGSYSGLTRYDGTNFESYDSVNGVPGVVSLYVDKKDRLWIGTNDNGLAMFENESFTSYADSETLSSRSIRALSEDADGNVIVGTTMGLGYVSSDGKLHSLNEAQLNGEYIDSLNADENGVIYGTTLTGSIFTLDGLRVRDFYDAESIQFGTPRVIMPDSKNAGNVYVGTEDSVVYTSIGGKLKAKKTYTLGGLTNINYLLPAGESIYVCSDDGIGILDKNRKFKLYDDLPISHSVDSATLDAEDNVWFTSSRQGIMKLVSNDFTALTENAGISGIVVNSTCLRSDLLYVGTDNGLVILDEKNKPVENDLTKMLEGIRIRSIKCDDDDSLYICTYSELGLLVVDKDNNIRSISSKDGLSSEKVRTSMVLSDGTVAVATGAGVNIIKKGRVEHVLDAEEGVKNSEILCIAEKSDGTLLMGSDGDGIYTYKNGNVKRIGRSDGLSSEVVMRIVADPEEQDAFWIVTSYRLDYMAADGTVSTLEKYPYADNFDLYFDNNGNVWILSGTGLYVGKRSSFFDKGALDVSFYNAENGMPCTATANSHSCISDDGILYIAGSSGVVTVDLNAALSSDNAITLSIPYIVCDDKVIPIDEDTKEITIPASTKRLVINAHAITYTLKNPKITYRLKGFDEQSFSTTRLDLEPAVYTNLDGGNYTFEISSLATGSADPLSTATIQIRKTYSFHERWYFWVLVVVCGMLGAGLVVSRHYVVKNRKLEEQKETQRRFINQTINAFAKAIDLKDRYTNGHSFRVANYTRLLARRIGLPDDDVDEMYNIALLHDIGKLSIPDHILNKPEALDDEEYEIMKTHAANGRDILKEITLEPNLSLGAGCHHERIDGRGYPEGLEGDEIPYVAQIIAVADTFDAMYSTRPYRKKLPLSVVMDEMKKISGSQLNPDIVKVFIELCEDGEIK